MKKFPSPEEIIDWFKSLPAQFEAYISTIPPLVFSDVLMGIVLLFAGRRLFWLSIIVIGFLVGMEWGQEIIPEIPDSMVLVYSLGFGIAGALLAILLQWLGALFVGFIGGGYFLVHFLPFMFGDHSTSWQALFIVGGVLGMLLMFFGFEFAVTAISSLVGATLIVQHVGVHPAWQGVILLALSLLGILIQIPHLDRRKERIVGDPKHV